jgi:thiol-disulfide isomerase/thioredoxin
VLDRATFLGGLVASVTTSAADFAARHPIKISANKQIIWKLRVLDGPDFQLADHRGSVVVMNFFTTWCPGCNDEAPDLIAFANAHPDDTIVVGIDVEERDNTVRAWRKRLAVPYRIAMDEWGLHRAGRGGR